MLVADLLELATPGELAEIDRLLTMPPDVRYQRDPIGWLVDVLGIPEATIRWSLNPEYRTHQWDGTKDPLAVMCESLAAGKDVGVESGTGTGKTYLAAGICLWFFACFEDALVVTTAPKEDQLTTQLWKEIGRHWPRFIARYPMARTVQLRVRFREGAGEDETWSIIGYACGVGSAEESANKARGFHAGHMLIVTEETPGVHAAVMAAFANTSTGDHNLRLALGNPDNQFDPLHTFCQEPGVQAVRISALDHPNVVCGREIIAGAAGRKSVTNLAAKWGDASPMFDAMVRGISPAQSADALIQLSWLEESAKRHARRTIQPDDLPAMGLDVANSENGDRGAKAKGRGNVLLSIESFPCPDATQLGTDAAQEAKREGIPPENIGLDSVGVGAATGNEMRRLMGGVRLLNGGAGAIDGAQQAKEGHATAWMPDANEHRNLRGQMWWQLREDVRLGNIDLPYNPELFRQLTMVKYEKRGGVVIVEEKAQTRKRLGRSPDDADAVVYWNWVRPRRVNPIDRQGRPIKQDDRAVRWDPKKKQRIERLPEEAWASMLGDEPQSAPQPRPQAVPRW